MDLGAKEDERENVWASSKLFPPRGCPAQHRAVIYQQIDGGKGEEFVWGGSESIYVGGGGGCKHSTLSSVHHTV